ncbi:MAG: tRNA (adenosine(37)-N6)-dimethylallyltransferase MiaA [Eubacterium sp.]|nr:tRNA (adenosine(37)-N6)-dimethylallyltransferase MiaA [Eubacterium sp.]
MINNISNRILVISGPTAVGKTDISLELAEKLNGEIINADSMQVYRGMNIGTAKLPEDKRKNIPHHLIDICDPSENYDVMRFQNDAVKCIEDITARGNTPILVGGTGFYIQAVLYDIDFSSMPPDEDFRSELEEYAKHNGAEALHDRLRAIDPVSADSIHSNNIKRVIRAIEYYEQTGIPFSEHNREQRGKNSPYDFLYAVLTMPREILYERIDKRVDEMIRDGLVNEVRDLLDQEPPPGKTAMQGLGYKEIASYLNGECSLDEAVRILKRDTRHFAKRQLTWFKRERSVTYFDKSEYSSLDLLAESIATCFENHIS